ncbi:CoxG family protein [Cytobacillus purgationiresistens]|uniref:Carbon monoxide dehydrogenase subunit G n=1 Tax=Cytobacillus purgationiresistens TaxID=863449 RepID=A0ABU0AEF9_9BACI|nr:SRPBCC family protein [Cytobacillus purgationiresistens]MDQ0268475.1 carbon monoxide dehydrogenase subunit G [Cytobacillus purgationiresistens]
MNRNILEDNFDIQMKETVQMPSYHHQEKVNVSIENLWTFVSDMNNWAPLVPGYIDHQIINEKESTWAFKTDVGIMKKKIELKVDITHWNEPSKVTFNLTGLNEKFTGEGFFSAVIRSSDSILMTGFLEINADGMMAKMANNILKSSLPEITTELTKAVARKAEELNAYHR